MPSFRRPFAAVAGLLLTAGLAAHPLPQRKAQGLLSSPAGRTLYTYDPDGSGGGSQCSGPCAAVWPPYTADAGATAPAGFSIVKRDDRSHQWAYRGRPLYLFAGDAKPGDHDGDGVNDQWHVVH